ncbi:MAG: hypothetical protein M3016_00085 [Actinomycetota bacterium]|nr:hypothetical protein [Actinomycetota bacterium]
MPVQQERYYEMLMDRVRADTYPSHQLLDRIEASFWTTEQVTEYVDLLLEKADQSTYMSPQLLDRIQRMLIWAAAA